MDRRKYERFSVGLVAKTSLMTDKKKEHTEIFDLFTRDICAGGAFFHALQPIPKGRQVNIDLLLVLNTLKELAGKTVNIKVKGKVIRTEARGLAVCFDKGYKITRI